MYFFFFLYIYMLKHKLVMYRRFQWVHMPGPKLTSSLCLFIGLVGGAGYKRS